MHIPDGYLDPIWCAGTYAVTIAYLIYAYRRVRANYDVSRAIPLMTVFAAGIFVAQMLNWPIPGGTSLHFVGGALSAIVLGPYLASYVIFLSRRHARRIVSIIRQLSSNSKTLIIATHDPCLLSITKSVVVLQSGIAETMSVADAYSDDYVSDLLGLNRDCTHDA